MKNKKILAIILLTIIIATLFVPFIPVSAADVEGGNYSYNGISYFSILFNGVSKVYQYDIGMTWGDWVTSSYNIDGFEFTCISSDGDTNYIRIDSSSFGSNGDYLLIDDGDYLMPSYFPIYSMTYSCTVVYDYSSTSNFFSVDNILGTIYIYDYTPNMTFNDWVLSSLNVNHFSIVSFDYYIENVINGVCISNESPKYIMLCLPKGGYVASDVICQGLVYSVEYYNETPGYSDAYNDGYDTGYKVGFRNGELSGYDIGYNDGVNAGFGDNLLGATLIAPVRALSSFVLYTSSNGFSVTLWHIFGAIFGLSLLLAFLKYFAGG